MNFGKDTVLPDEAAFPLPGRALAEKELQRDALYARIPPENREEVLKRAWSKGEQAARQIYRQYEGETDLIRIGERSGLRFQWDERDCTPAGRRRFAEYLPEHRCVLLYRGGIRLLAEKNGIPMQRALDLVLGHEFFHFLEHQRLGWTSRDYLVPLVYIGQLRLGKTGIRALSEVGAHAFAYTWSCIKQGSADGICGERYGADTSRRGTPTDVWPDQEDFIR